LFGVGDQAGFQFGGIGLMIREPRTEIAIGGAGRLEIEGSETASIRESVERWFVWQRPNLKSQLGFEISAVDDLPVCLKLVSMPARHQGLGTGTQIAFATALALNSGFGLGIPGAEEFSIALNRGGRSAIGSFGFFLGGLLVDRGKCSGDQISPLDFRTDFPTDWPILMFLERDATRVGLSGQSELVAFDQLLPTSESDRQDMVNIVQNEILSGLMQKNYESFGEALYQFGRKSGLLFASVQYGAYHSQPVVDLVEFVRACGYPAVGQSSWGPGVFAILPSNDRRAELIQQIEKRFPDRYQITSTTADNQGAVITEAGVGRTP
jgi:beta-RFAP synthase